MLRIKRAFNLLFLIVLLSGCGEAFRGSSSSGSENDTEFAYGERRFSETNVQVDRLIRNDYANELIGSENEMDILAGRIDALDFILKGNSNQTLDMTARMVLGCNNVVRFSANTTPDEMHTMRPVDLGRSGDYEAEVRCSQLDCQEMVLVVRKYRGGNEATILAGLRYQGTDASTAEAIFITRNVDDRYFHSFPTVANFESRANCSISDDNNSGSSGNFLDRLEDKVVDWIKDLIS